MKDWEKEARAIAFYQGNGFGVAGNQCDLMKMIQESLQSAYRQGLLRGAEIANKFSENANCCEPCACHSEFPNDSGIALAIKKEAGE